MLKKNEKAMNSNDFWDDNERAQEVLKSNKTYNNTIDGFKSITDLIEEMGILIEMEEENSAKVLGSNSLEDPELDRELIEVTKTIDRSISEMMISTLLKGEYDINNAILSINPGTGGLDAQDWAQMLLRMYIRWAEDGDFKVKLLDIISDPEAGIKTATILVIGTNAYGYLKGEKGVHRLVRMSPFDSSGKRHTSFASVDVMPEIDDEIEVELNPSDLKIDTFRASGAGGQHVNTTDSAVRITHLPTGVVVSCQNERSQHLNREVALKMLISKLISIKEEENMEKIEDLKGSYSQISWGSQIRSYVFHPYRLVKDHRTNIEVTNLDDVMDGAIDEFINGYLKSK